MNCIALFVLVVLAAVAMAQESSFSRETGNTDPGRTPESGEVQRVRRGLALSRYLGGGYNPQLEAYKSHAIHYRAPSAYYGSRSNYGYGSYY